LPSPASPPSAPDATPAPAAPVESKANYLPAGLALGVGVAGIAVGSVLGILTLNKASQLSSACQPKNDCPAGEQGDLNSASALALGSTIGFGVGAVGAVLGTYFLIRPPRSEKKAGAESARVTPWIGLGGAGLAGTF
jgi:hypothetical protein